PCRRPSACGARQPSLLLPVPNVRAPLYGHVCRGGAPQTVGLKPGLNCGAVPGPVPGQRGSGFSVLILFGWLTFRSTLSVFGSCSSLALGCDWTSTTAPSCWITGTAALAGWLAGTWTPPAHPTAIAPAIAAPLSTRHPSLPNSMLTSARPSWLGRQYTTT